jgi:hypothetical protein
MATLFEVVLVIGLVSRLISRSRSQVLTPARFALFAVLIAAVAVGTTVALARPPLMGR